MYLFFSEVDKSISRTKRFFNDTLITFIYFFTFFYRFTLFATVIYSIFDLFVTQRILFVQCVLCSVCVIDKNDVTMLLRFSRDQDGIREQGIGLRCTTKNRARDIRRSGDMEKEERR